MKINLTGERFGRLVVVGVARKTEKNLYWKCLCDCGNYRSNTWITLKKKIVISCGCYHRELMTKHGDNPHIKTRGKKRAPEYRSWENMKDRCYNKKNASYHHYGNRGIVVCDRWRNSYINFIADMGRKPHPQHTIDRINTNGNYEPSNCRWADKITQARNRNPRSHYRGNPIRRSLETV